MIQQEIIVKPIIATAIAGLLCLGSGIASAQTQAQPQGQTKPQTQTQMPSQTPPPIAGKTTLGVAVAQMETVLAGWSAKKDLLGKSVVNDQKQKVGKIDDIIVTPDNAVSFAIVGTGGFVGMGKHNVAIPMEQIKVRDGDLVLSGATKEALKALPSFEYAKK
jgi:sporulation protein YlmC with PRC-barrel domain